jgi:hypothetical protein
MTNAKPIRVKSEEQFERLRDSIDLEVSHAADHFYLLKGLEASRKDYALEMNESNTFWHLTLLAHRDAVLSHLCRLYDKHEAALSLGKFLVTVKNNRDLFSDAAFRKRLKDNPHVDRLVTGRAIDDTALEKEFDSVSGGNPLVRKLWKLRDTVISHTSADNVAKGKHGAARASLPVQDIEVLLRRAGTITSKYSLFWGASRYGGIAGADDYTSTLQWVRKALAAHRAGVDEQIRQATNAR